MLVTSIGRHPLVGRDKNIAERTWLHEHNDVCQPHNATLLQMALRNICKSDISRRVLSPKMVHVTGHYQTQYMDPDVFEQVCECMHVCMYVCMYV